MYYNLSLTFQYCYLFIYFNDGGGHAERKGVKSEIIKKYIPV